MSRFGGIVLAGGRSSRMGSPKAELGWRGITLLEHVVSIVAPALDGPVVVAAAPGQELPELRGEIEVVRDAHAGRGPLEGVAAGLRTLEGRVDAAFVSATDTPFLTPAFVHLVCAALSTGADAAVPMAGERMYPLAAAYRTGVLPLVEAHLAADRLRAIDLVEALNVRWISEDELRAVDPDLAALRNLNTPAEYEDALRAGS